jgi:hypothetical protein
MTSKTLLAMLLVLLTACNGKNATQVEVDIKHPRPLETNLDSVQIINDKLVINGSGFSSITKVEMTGTGTSGSFSIESVSANKIVAYASSAAMIAVGKSLNLLIGNAEAQSTYQISFDLDDHSVTAQKLHHMGATSGQVLKYNGTTWVPSSLPASQMFLGAFDAANNNPDLSVPSNTPGDYFIVSDAGTFGGINYGVGDWIISDGSNWQKISNPQPMVHSFQNRTGAVVLTPGDYVSLKHPVTHKLPGSSLGDIADVDMTGLAVNKVLKYDGSHWVVADDIVAIKLKVIYSGRKIFKSFFYIDRPNLELKQYVTQGIACFDFIIDKVLSAYA